MTSGAPRDARNSAAIASDAQNAEERWTQWLAKGAIRDQRLSERMRYVTALVGAGLLGWLAFALATR
jgi:hypothetical protein